MTQVNKDRRPIYYKNAEEMDKPLSELMEELRTEIDKTRGKLHDMKRSYGWEDLIEPIEGGLTCILKFYIFYSKNFNFNSNFSILFNNPIFFYYK